MNRSGISRSDRAVSRWAGVAAVLSLGLLASSPAPLEGAEGPFGLKSRVPWDGSRLTGSPEPPLPYTVEKTLTKHAWKTPIYVIPEPGTSLLWVSEGLPGDKPGFRVVRVPSDPQADTSEVMLELPDHLVYSICFHPNYENNGFVYIFSNGLQSDQTNRRNEVTRYTVRRDGGRALDPASAKPIIGWRSGGHDGGDMAFGADGMFYVTTGDGTSDSDTWNSGQTLDDLLGSVLRLDVDHPDGDRAYGVPADNPFVALPGARAEIWAYGLRNPWRMCGDEESGQIWVGNNGQDLWETSYLVRKGDNYGWSVWEGSHPFYLERKRGPTPLVPPTIEHSHAEFRSLTGGVVYRGARFPELDGAYVYGDYSSGRIWAMKHDGQRVLWHREIADTALQIASFRVDQAGELLITDYTGGFFRLIPSPRREPAPPFPATLSGTGLFASTREHKPAPGLIPYGVIAPGWADGARAERFLAVPGEEKVGFDAERPWTFPDGTALAQTLSIERQPGDPTSRMRLETRVLLKQQNEWAGYTYKWDPDQSEARLVGKGGEDALSLTVGGGRWRFPSRADCMSCHSRAAGFVLGVTGQQMNREFAYEGVVDNQLRALDHIGYFTSPLPKPPAELPRLVDPADESGDLEARVKTYLHVNCSVCHVEAGGGNSRMQLAFGTARAKMNVVGARPQHDTFGIANAMLVAPGSPDQSVILHRLGRRGAGQMPPLVSNRVDEATVRLIREWISRLEPEQKFVRAWGLAELTGLLERVRPAEALEAGRTVFRDTGCAQCHRFEGEGGTVGPDLAGISKRLRPQEILESIIDPSRKIADEYANFLVATEDGAVHSGRVEGEDDEFLVLRPPPPGEVVRLRKSEVVERRRSDQSNMPVGIVNVLREEQILSLLGYLLLDPPSPRP